MEFYLNGEKRNYEGDPNLNLMDYLRNTEKIISPKDGCSPEGVCGCYDAANRQDRPRQVDSIVPAQEQVVQPIALQLCLVGSGWYSNTWECLQRPEVANRIVLRCSSSH